MEWKRSIVLCASTVVALLHSSEASTCVSVNTLTSSCEELCFTGRPCIAFTTGIIQQCTPSMFNTCVSSTTTGCSYACLKYSIDDFIENNVVEYSKFTFLIPYGGYKSPWELKWDEDDKNAVSTQPQLNDTSVYPSMNDNMLNVIAPLHFRPSMKVLTIAGGSSVSAGVRGRVVDVQVAPSVLADQANLQTVTLSNIQLEQVPLNSFPSQLVNFTLSNCVLNQFPSDIEQMTNLIHLDLSKNYLKSYPAKFGGLRYLEVLNLSQNSLESFDAEGFQALTSLDLSDNLLSSIPNSIFNFTKLQSLDLRKNSFTNVVFTPEQVQFLSSINSLQVDKLGISTSCTAKTTLHGIDVCIGTNTNGDHGGNGGNNQTVLIGGIIGGVVVVLIVVLLFFFYHRRRSAHISVHKSYNKSQTGSDREEAYTSSAGVGSLWNDQELLSLQVNADDIQDVRKLGSGAFCIVYLAKYRGNRFVASKRLKRDELNQKNTKLFIAEIKLVASLDHPRIVALVGVAWTIEADLQALFEYMEHGDLRGYLEDSSTCRVWSNEKIQMAIDAVEGLVYVHSFTPPIVHRDLKSRNILLDEDVRAKLCDFGVARYRSEVNTMTTGVGTGRWLAPEVISGSSDYGQACDVFSFGVVLSEIDTHALPYEDVRGPSGNRIADVALLQMVAGGTIVPSFTRTCPLDLYQLAVRCLALHPEDRPTAVEIAYALRTIQRQYNTM